MMMRVSVAGATGAIGKQLAPRLAAGEVGAVLMTELRGACNAKAKRGGNEGTGGLGRQPRHPSWRQGLAS
jgi:nucleoside-diphosphate-sugar epimerase